LIPDRFYEYIGSLIGYKVLLTLCLTLLLAWIVLLIIFELQKTKGIEPTGEIQTEAETRSEIERSQTQVLSNLSREERALLKLYFAGEPQTKYLNLSMYHPVANALERQGILHRTGNGMIDLNVFFHINHWAWAYLNEHPELLKLS